MSSTVYNQLESFCKVKNRGTARHNGEELTPRVEWIIELLLSLGIDYELDQWPIGDGVSGWNLYLKSGREKPLVLMAHHDIVNPESDNANDNSASIINAISLKLKRPDVWVVLTDAEEIGGLGAARYADLVNRGLLAKPEWILNLELTGVGGESFFIGDDPVSPLKSYLVERHGASLVKVPFNDSCILRRHGLDSCVINPLPRDEQGEFEMYRLMRCHTLLDQYDRVSLEDMEKFVDFVLIPIVDNWIKT